MLNSTSGGDSDTELNELIVSPRGSPASENAVTTATPVGNTLSASRKARSSKLTIDNSRLTCHPCNALNGNAGATFNRAARRAPVRNQARPGWPGAFSTGDGGPDRPAKRSGIRLRAACHKRQSAPMLVHIFWGETPCLAP